MVEEVFLDEALLFWRDFCNCHSVSDIKRRRGLSMGMFGPQNVPCPRCWALVPDDAAGEAGEDRSQGCDDGPVRHPPNSGDGCTSEAVPGDPRLYSPAERATAGLGITAADATMPGTRERRTNSAPSRRNTPLCLKNVVIVAIRRQGRSVGMRLPVVFAFVEDTIRARRFTAVVNRQSSEIPDWMFGCFPARGTS